MDISRSPRIPLDARRLRAAKKAYTTRYVATAVESQPSGHTLVTDAVPRAGDVVLARVRQIGHHQRLESALSRRQLLFPGDEMLVAYGNRYAPDQFLAVVPDDLDACHLVAAGGVAGRVLAQHTAVKPATVIEPLGLLADEGGVVTLARSAPLSPAAVDGAHRPSVIAVLGTSMNSGKSTTLATLVHGLSGSGLVVSAGKATGTGSGNDVNLFHDAGATRVLDFTDFGLASTSRLPLAQIAELWTALVDNLALDAPDVIVVEVADGIFQEETAALVAHPAFSARIDGVVFAAQDALGASAGVAELRRHGVNVLAASGVVTASPLAAAEARTALSVPVIDTFDLCDAEVATALLPVAARR